MNGEQNFVFRRNIVLELLTIIASMILLIGIVIAIILFCFVFICGVLMVCYAPIFIVCLIHMKIKGWKKHEYHFLGSTISIDLGEKEEKNVKRKTNG